MKDLARLLVFSGVLLVAAGLVIALVSRTGLGKLPGDFVMRRGTFTFYFPLMTSILISLVLSLLFWIFKR